MRSRTVRPLKRREHGAGAMQSSYGYPGSQARVRRAPTNRRAAPQAEHAYGMQHSVYNIPFEGERHSGEGKEEPGMRRPVQAEEESG